MILAIYSNENKYKCRVYHIIGMGRLHHGIETEATIPNIIHERSQGYTGNATKKAEIMVNVSDATSVENEKIHIRSKKQYKFSNRIKSNQYGNKHNRKPEFDAYAP
ncbi:hypothetical protein AA13595_2064 [Gluconacetobacter johannae DSM 13595]|nr:hypothetical protein AA13595_2064 [Gluconacetobacter johannae DSM 13595]